MCVHARGLGQGALVAALLILLSLGACAPQRSAIDWNTVEAEGRVVDQPAGLDVLAGRKQYRWTDGEVQLTVAEVGSLFRKGPRLFVDVRGTGDTSTQFMLDTGSTGSILSAAAPLAREVRVSRKARYRVEHGRKAEGYLGFLPVVHVGPLTGRDLAVAIREVEHTAREPANVLGIIHLFHTQLEHDGARWWLRSGSARRASTQLGWKLVKMETGLTFVRVTDPTGQPVYAMIDTGANASFAVQGFPEGVYSVSATDGSIALRVHARDTAPWPGLEAAGYKIALLIGMDVLSSRPCRLTFNESAWAIGPAPR